MVIVAFYSSVVLGSINAFVRAICCEMIPVITVCPDLFLRRRYDRPYQSSISDCCYSHNISDYMYFSPLSQIAMPML